MIPYGKQTIEKDDIKAVLDAMRGDWLTQGPKVLEFEKALAKYGNVKYALAVSSGTTALQLAYMALGLKQGDEVITTPLTFAATSNCLAHLKAQPVFCDISPETLNINYGLIEKKITRKTKAISAVDFAGLPCDWDKIKKIAKKYNLYTVADACHSLGALYKGRKVGSLADITCLSFHPVKLITTAEGGAVLTNNKKLYQKMALLRHHGVKKFPQKGGWYYEVTEIGFNGRITDIQCALGLSQLKKINRFLQKRRQIIKMYNRAFVNIKELVLPKEPRGYQSAWHLYVLQFDKTRIKVSKKQIYNFLREQGIGVQAHYLPLHLHSFYRNYYGYKKGDFPEAEKYYQQAFSLPLYPTLKANEIAKVIKAVKLAITKYAS